MTNREVSVLIDGDANIRDQDAIVAALEEVGISIEEIDVGGKGFGGIPVWTVTILAPFKRLLSAITTTHSKPDPRRLERMAKKIFDEHYTTWAKEYVVLQDKDSVLSARLERDLPSGAYDALPGCLATASTKGDRSFTTERTPIWTGMAPNMLMWNADQQRWEITPAAA